MAQHIIKGFLTHISTHLLENKIGGAWTCLPSARPQPGENVTIACTTHVHIGWPAFLQTKVTLLPPTCHLSRMSSPPGRKETSLYSMSSHLSGSPTHSILLLPRIQIYTFLAISIIFLLLLFPHLPAPKSKASLHIECQVEKECCRGSLLDVRRGKP